MLSPQEMELLTARVDGELTARQKRHLERLLRRSPEARALLAKLEKDSRELRTLPEVALPFDLSETLLDRIATLPPRRTVRTRPALVPAPAPSSAEEPRTGYRPSALQGWYGYAAAASVLLLVGIGSFLAHSTGDRPTEPKEIAHGPKVNPAPVVPGKEGDSDREVVQAPPRLMPPTENPPPMEEDEDSMPVRPMSPMQRKELEPERIDEAVLTSGGKETPGKFERIELALPSVFDIHKLDVPESAAKLRAELPGDNAHRIEILCRDATRGFDRLRAALHEQRVNLHMDPVAAARLKKPLWRTDFALFVENLTPEATASIVRAAGLADRQAGEKKVSEYRFDGAFVLARISTRDRRELSDLLGLDPISQRPSSVTNKPVDIRRPISEQTSEQVLASLDGRGPARPGSQPTLQAYLAPLSGPRGRSAELKRFLESRQAPAPGTIQLLFVLRNVGG